jgi:short-subunit dehydrogenase
MNVAMLGATRGMGRSLARLMAERGDALCLLGHEPWDLEPSCKDLEARGAAASWVECNLLERGDFGPALDAAIEKLGDLNCVVVTAGLFASQEDLEEDTEERDRLLRANFVNTVHFCEVARRRLLARGGGTLCVFSSVAGDRGRQANFLYGAAKAGLSCYLEGLDHKFRRQGLTTLCVKPGFVKTSMTAGLEPPPFAGEPEDVARTVLRAMDRGRPQVYVPPIWRWVMLVISSLPRQLMRRLRF